MASFKQLSKHNWQVRYYHNKKQKKKQGFKTKKDAMKYAEQFKLSNESNVEFRVLLQDFFDFKEKGLKKLTRDRYVLFNNTLKERLGNYEVSELKEKMLLEFLKEYDNRPHQQDKYRKYLKMVYDHGIIYYNLSNNPMNKIKLNTKIEKKEKEIWTNDEFNEFIEILNKKDFRNEDYRKHFILYYKTLFYSGARPGEISGLTKKDIDIKNNTININKTRIDNKTSNSPKTKNSYRKVLLQKELINELKEYSEMLFGNENTYLFQAIGTYQNLLLKVIKEYNLKHITLHGFRHSHVSILLNNNVDIATIAAREGHSPRVMLDIYTHHMNNQEKVLEILERNK